MKIKTCLKCNHIAEYEKTQPSQCPACGAFYNKVEESILANTDAERARSSGPESTFSSSRPSRRTRNTSPAGYVEELRSNSIYPTFRSLVGILYWLGVAIALLVLVFGVAAGLKAGASVLIGSVVTSIFIFVMARVSKEMSHMLADLSDATVAMATRQANNDGN